MFGSCPVWNRRAQWHQGLRLPGMVIIQYDRPNQLTNNRQLSENTSFWGLLMYEPTSMLRRRRDTRYPTCNQKFPRRFWGPNRRALGL